MFIIKQIFNNLVKRKTYTVITTLFIMLQITLLFVYSYNYVSNIREYEKVCRTIPVTGKLTNNTNTLDTGLKINSSVPDKLEEVTHLRETREISVLHSYAGTETDKRRPSLLINAVNSLECIPAIKKEKINFFDGYDESYLSNDKNYAVLSKSFIEKLGTIPDNTYKIKVFYPEYDQYGGYTFVYKELANMEVKVIGVYDDTAIGADEPDSFQPHIIISSGFYKQLCKENDYEPHYDAYSFTLDNPDELNKFKKAAQKLGLQNMKIDGNQKEYRIGNTLVINDKVFIESANHILRDHKLYLILYPVIFAIIALLSFSISFLSLQYRKREIGIMYSMGVSSMKAGIIFTGEKLLTSIFAIFIVTSLFWLSTGNMQVEYVMILLIYLVCDYLGTVIAQFIINKKSVLYILREE